MARGIDLRVIVAGGGAVGQVAALDLARAGATVILVDPAPIGANASGVAAGMLAPAFECLFDQAAPALKLLRRARDLWPALAGSANLTLDRTGAMAVGRPGELNDWQAGLDELGIGAMRLSPAEASARAPWLRAGLGAVFSREDWRLEPGDALPALRAAFEAAGGLAVGQSLTRFEPGAGRLDDGRVLAADLVVIATGASPFLTGLAPELALLQPVKGHILRAPGLTFPGPVLRHRGGYLCPREDGMLIGATMEPGRRDGAVDAAEVGRLRALAAEVAPCLAEATLVARTGVRASLPDGLPMVGRSRAPGVWLAVGARRNGWLLAPLIARVLLAAVAGERPCEPARSFDPGRFEAP